jgi:hypothetical protein
MSAEQGLVTIYQNIGIILGISSAIAGTIANFVKQHLNHGKNAQKIEKIAQYINESHDFVTGHADKFTGLVQAATDIDPQLKSTLEAHGADVNKVVADSEVGKAKLKQILDEINTLTELDSSNTKK